MEIIRDKKDMRNWSRARRKEGHRIALVPTMGSLHAGHLSLVHEATQRADVVVVSIYVNPGQFAPGEDLGTYPKDFEGDLKKLELFKVDAVFNPHDLYVRDGGTVTTEEKGNLYTKSVGNNDKLELEATSVLVDGAYDSNFNEKQMELYRENNLTSCLECGNQQGHETWVRVERLEKHLCGQYRPIFFRGVATVVSKLFNIVEPDMALFGKKDYQQWRVICRMVRDLDFGVEVVGCELLREPDGLAMSSRNVFLSAAERKKALSISRSLKEAEAAVKKGDLDAHSLIKHVWDTIVEAGGRVDYVEAVEQVSLRPVETIDCPVVLCVAAHFGCVRLIDNVELWPQPSSAY